MSFEIAYSGNSSQSHSFSVKQMRELIVAYNDSVSGLVELSHYVGRRRLEYSYMLEMRQDPTNKLISALALCRSQYTGVYGGFSKQQSQNILSAMKNYETYYQETVVLLNGMNIHYSLDMVFAFDKLLSEYKKIKKQYPLYVKQHTKVFDKMYNFCDNILNRIGEPLNQCLNGEISLEKAIEISDLLIEKKMCIYIQEMFKNYNILNSVKEDISASGYIQEKRKRQYIQEKRLNKQLRTKIQIYDDLACKNEEIDNLQKRILELEKENSLLKQSSRSGLLQTLISKFGKTY